MKFIDLIKNCIPIIQAPMAGGYTPPKLVAAVSNTGAIGSFGFSYSNANKINDDLIEVRKLTNKVINSNFFIFPETKIPSHNELEEAIDVLKSLPLNAKYTIPSKPFFPSLDQQLEPIWKHKPQLLTFHFGLPPKYVIEKAHSYGIFVGVTATSFEEAYEIEKSGSDFVVAQGIEAGGHRGTFNSKAIQDKKLSTFELSKILVKQCSIPIISAGGIMNGEDIRTFINEGVVAVQMGTAFLCCDEAGTNKIHRQYILNKKERNSVFTKNFSGRYARGIDNEFISLMDGKVILPFPLQNTLTAPLRKEASKIENGEYQSFWAGKEFKKARSLPVDILINELKSEMNN
jgi:nitronate monooxygenase